MGGGEGGDHINDGGDVDNDFDANVDGSGDDDDDLCDKVVNVLAGLPFSHDFADFRENEVSESAKKN